MQAMPDVVQLSRANGLEGTLIHLVRRYCRTASACAPQLTLALELLSKRDIVLSLPYLLKGLFVQVPHRRLAIPPAAWHYVALGIHEHKLPGKVAGGWVECTRP